MNFTDFHFDENLKNNLRRLTDSGRLPHAVIIESRSAQAAEELARFLTMLTVCTSDDAPCGVCRECLASHSRAHADVVWLQPENKSKTYSMAQIRSVIEDAYIKPNGSGGKAYVFENADERFKEDSQNAFLKLLEEPPRGVRFILICRSALSLLPTVLSRCTVIRVGGDDIPGEEAREAAERIVRGIVSGDEYPLLLALNVLTDREKADGVFAALRLIMRDGIALLTGAEAIFGAESAKALASRLTKSQILALREPTDRAAALLRQNVNANLTVTWLCGEYRRISWQK